jgi:AcrR family transcriptional regulator
MSPRPRKATDEEIFAAAQRTMSRLGPGELTLADIAAEAGLTAGALVQRFGSKRGLLLSLAARYADSAGELMEDLRRRHQSPLDALRAYADCMSQLAASPSAFARNLAYLEIDLTDPEFRRHLVVQARATRRGLQKLIKEAVAEGELISTTNAAALARTVEAIVSGSMMAWAFYREGSAKRWVRQDLATILAPYIA